MVIDEPDERAEDAGMEPSEQDAGNDRAPGGSATPAGDPGVALWQGIYERLRDREDPPRPWTGPGEAPWSDETFSADFARVTARDAETTAAEIQCILSACGLPLEAAPGNHWSILDLGCGDGRLLLPLCRGGHRGFGLDLGPAPVRRLRELAKAQGLHVEARVADLRDWSRGRVVFSGADRFDLVLLSFGTLGAVPREDGMALLSRVAESLSPGGWLHLDLGLSTGFAEELDGRQEWWVADDFVTGAGRQLVLDDHSFDREERVYVRRSFALRLEEPLKVREVRQTTQLYEREELRAMLQEVGLEVVHENGDFFFSPFQRDRSENLVVSARKHPVAQPPDRPDWNLRRFLVRGGDDPTGASS